MEGLSQSAMNQSGFAKALILQASIDLGCNTSCIDQCLGL